MVNNQLFVHCVTQQLLLALIPKEIIRTYGNSNEAMYDCKTCCIEHRDKNLFVTNTCNTEVAVLARQHSFFVQ